MTRTAIIAGMLLGLLLAGPAFGHAVPGGAWSYQGPTRLTKVGTNYVAPLAFRNAANASRTVRTATLAPGRVGGLLRGRLFSPWGAAITAVIAAAGYAIDELQQQVLAPPAPTVDPVSGYPLLRYGTTTPEFWSCADAHAAYPVCAWYGWGGLQSCDYPALSNTPGASVSVVCTNGLTISGAFQVSGFTSTTCPDGYSLQSGVCVLTDPALAQPTPLDDVAIEKQLVPLLTDQQKLDLFFDPATGQPEPLPEEQTLHDKLERDWIAQTDPDPVTVPEDPVEEVDDQTYQEQQQRQQNTMNPPPLPEYDTQLEVPQKRDLPTVLDQARSTLDGFASRVGLSATAGACAIDVPIAISGASRQSSIDFCSWAPALADIGSILLMLSYLTAGLIVLRA